MSKKKTKKNSANKSLAIVLLIAVIILAAAVCLLFSLESEEAPSSEASTPTEVAQGTFATISQESQTNADSAEASGNNSASDNDSVSESGNEAARVDEIQEMNRDLGQDLVISDIGRYVGIYMEDGSDEVVSGILMIVLTNNSELPLEYAEIELTAGDSVASFSVSTLPAGSSAVLLEKNRMGYDSSVAFEQATAKNISFFDEPLNLHEDEIQIQGLDGVMNITNISGENIDEDIVIYYKNSSQDMYYGGITYRVRITGGMVPGEIKQIVSDHFSDTGSTIMFVSRG